MPNGRVVGRKPVAPLVEEVSTRFELTLDTNRKHFTVWSDSTAARTRATVIL